MEICLPDSRIWLSRASRQSLASSHAVIFHPHLDGGLSSVHEEVEVVPLLVRVRELGQRDEAGDGHAVLPAPRHGHEGRLPHADAPQPRHRHVAALPQAARCRVRAAQGPATTWSSQRGCSTWGYNISVVGGAVFTQCYTIFILVMILGTV
jgi:hypothetical protein